MTRVRTTLGDVVSELESGGRPPGGSCASGVLSVGGEHVAADGAFVLHNKCFVPQDYYDAMQRGKLKRDDILVVKDGATTGKVGFVDGTLRLPAAVNEHVFRLTVDEDKAFPRYVFYYLLSPQGNREILYDFRGATVGGISQDFPEQVRLPLPDLPTQRRIAGILDQADRLRRMRRYALELSDQFLPALFLRMFGDPTTNPHGWETVELDDLLSTDPQNGIYKPESEYGSGTPILRIDAFYDGVVTGLADLKRVRLSQEEIATYQLNAGNVVVNRVNSPEFLGKSALIPALKEPTVFESNMMRLDVNEASINRVYLIHFLQTEFVKRQILSAAKNAVNQSSINQQDVRALAIQRPPRDGQDSFARLVTEHLLRASIRREALRQAEHLFQSLLNQYFGKET
jgi:type I restriction enzyme S subunit